MGSTPKREPLLVDARDVPRRIEVFCACRHTDGVVFRWCLITEVTSALLTTKYVTSDSIGFRKSEFLGFAFARAIVCTDTARKIDEKAGSREVRDSNSAVIAC